MRAPCLTFLGFAALLTVSCGFDGHSPAAPTNMAPVPGRTSQTWALSGQSNAVLLRPPLSAYAIIVGAAQSGESIQSWAVGGPLWTQLAPTLGHEVSAFVWFQGESDADFGRTPGAPLTSVYVDRLRDLVSRVRTLTSPDLVVVVCGLTNAPDNQTEFDMLRGEQRRFVATDSNAVYVPTLDLPSEQPCGRSPTPIRIGRTDEYQDRVCFEGSQHLTPQGYVMLSARIASAIAGSAR